MSCSFLVYSDYNLPRCVLNNKRRCGYDIKKDDHRVCECNKVMKSLATKTPESEWIHENNPE